jgi:plasmid stability protein
MPEMRKTSLSLPEPLWRRARVRAAQEDRDLQDVVADALTLYLKTPLKRAEGGR